MTRKSQRILRRDKGRKYCELMIKILELEQSRYGEEFCSVGFRGQASTAIKAE